MTLPSLPGECLGNVFSFLNSSFLYKCLFVNRYYCKLSVPIIWKDPFKSTKTKTHTNKSQISPMSRTSLINTLITCLNEDEISSLIPYLINFNSQIPLFDYGKFVRNINHEYYVQNIINYLNAEEQQLINSNSDDFRVQKLVNAIYHMILRQGSNLQNFGLNSHFLPEFSIFTTYQYGITNLRSLSIDINLDSKDYQNVIEFLSMLPKFNNRIINFELKVYPELKKVEPFLDIIKSQPLKRMLISTEVSHGNVKEKNILHALEFRSETLKELTFKNFNLQEIDLLFISSLECLEHLEFINCNGFTFKHHETLSKKKFLLKKLRLWHNNVGLQEFYVGDPNGLSNIIKTMVDSLCGKLLRKLALNVITLEIIEAVRRYCPNIILLHVKIPFDDSSDQIISSICNFPSLKTLHVEIKKMSSADINAGLLVKTLGDHLISVEYLLLDFPISNLYEYITNNNCKAKLKVCIQRNSRISSSASGWIMVTRLNHFTRMAMYFLNALGIDYRVANDDELVDLLKKKGIDIILSDY